ncbi:MAG: radical SAM family heme chaperone HemW [Erysipelotrichaceae bacterium]|nr:radical SAM family heme chaperone HemW [Erysipelotrichaceae bacterium]MDY5252274.1 radical SAM family heme chaperone HemW [Erysipelotrichaceae bacterium]
MSKGLYIHVPFCKTICFYCDFCHVGYNQSSCDDWLSALAKQLEQTKIEDIDTIYIGGGTPNCLDHAQLDRLLTLLDPYVSSVKEYTMEINAEAMDEIKYKLFKKHGINRVSIGLQTTDHNFLRLLNRKATFEDVKQCIEKFIKHGIDNISVDLMYSLPFQHLEDLAKDLDLIVALPIKHVSIYALTIEENTFLGKQGFINPDEEIEADMYLLAIDKLHASGFKQYEVSNFAKEGYESQHNLHYWYFDDFYGLGPGASGKIDHVLYDNTKDIRKYINDPFLHEATPFKDKEEEMFEHIMMNLRLVKGIDSQNFKQCYGVDLFIHYEKIIDELIRKNLLIKEGLYLRCTKEGFPLLNTILTYFL